MMDSYVTLQQFPILTIGCIAGDILDKQIDGFVEVVFDSTFYIRSDDRLICLGQANMAAGPINCITSASKSVNWRASGLKQHSKARITPTSIEIGNRYHFPISGSHHWSAEPSDLNISNLQISRGLDIFRAVITGQKEIDGLGKLLIPGYEPEPHHYVCRAAKQPIMGAKKWLATMFQGSDGKHDLELNWVRKLSGLGPGLTPSGDDLLGGMMIALHSLGRGEWCQSLWPFVELYANENGNIISQAHISAASKGFGGAGIHGMIAAILAGDADRIYAAVKDVAAIGHSSGWDTMTGIVITIEAWLGDALKN